MKEIHISIQHILQDLMMILSLLRGKTTESIFVDIYSNDGITLNAAQNHILSSIQNTEALRVKKVACQRELETLLNEKNDFPVESFIDEPLTHYAVFDNLSAELIQLKRYDFILNWYKKVWVLAINPVSLFLVSRWRFVLNLLVLLASFVAYKQVPSSSLIQYFVGENSPLFYLIWLPYAFLLLFDLRYLARLNLLMSEMTRRLGKLEVKESVKTIILLTPCIALNPELLRKVKHLAREMDAHIIHFTDSANTKEFADMSFEIPKHSQDQLLKYMGVLSGHSESENDTYTDYEGLNVELDPIDARILDFFNKSGLVESYTPTTCYKLVLNYEYLSNRFEISSEDKSIVAQILLKKFATDRDDTTIGFASDNPNNEWKKVKELVAAYL